MARDPVARRTRLKLAGFGLFSTATAHVGTDRAIASDTVGYGGNGYGTTAYGASSQIEPSLHINTSDATNITQTTATLHGTVSDFGGASTVTVQFAYRPTEVSSWSTTPDQSLSATGTVSSQISGLTPATDYEFRVRTTASDGDTATSATATFTTKQHTLVIDGAPSPSTLNPYSFTVSDSVEKSPNLGSIQANDTITGQTVSGEVLGGRDGYRFTGDVTSFDVDGNPDIYLDGEPVTPTELGDTTYPNTMVIDGSPAPRQRATYDATVNGNLTKTNSLGSIQSNDIISGSTATGQVWGGKDAYRFTGDVTELSVDGKMTILLKHGDSSSTSSNVLPNTVVVDGSGTPDQIVSYTITVSGDAEKSGELGSINAYDTVRSGEISGRIVGGKDGYRFSGDVTQIEIEGPAILQFAYTEG